MIQNFIGAETFRKALHKYLNHFQYKNATTNDLAQFLEDESGKPIKSIMKDWTRQQGFPLISVSKTDKGIRVSQQRYLSSGAPTPEQDQVVWKVPLLIRTSASDEIHSLVLETRSMDIELRGPLEWVKLNAGQSGAYRVKYSDELVQGLVSALGSLDVLDRIGVHSDASSLAQSGMQSTTSLLTLWTGIGGEQATSVWQLVSEAVAVVDGLVANTSAHKEFSSFVCELYAPLAAKLGWDATPQDDHNTTKLRTQALSFMGKYGDEATLVEARRRFDEYVKERSDKVISADLRPAVAKMLLTHGGNTEWEQVVQLREASGVNPMEAAQMLASLGACKDVDVLNQTLEYALSDRVRSQDKVYGFMGVARNTRGVAPAWESVKRNWQTINDTFQGGFMTSYFVKCADSFFDADKAADVEAYFKDKDVPAAKMAIQQTAEKIRTNAAWLARDGASVEQWLQARV